jgi:hypothetical protein
MYSLITSLTHYEHTYSVFPFGEFVHYTDKREAMNVEEIKSYLVQQGLTNIHIERTQPTIEDTFMELAK